MWVKIRDEWRKIASIGIGVRKWVSYHGIALNVSTDLSYFDSISACGFEGKIMTSLEELCRENKEITPSMDEVKDALVKSICEVFDLRSRALRKEYRDFRGKRPSWLKVKAPGSPEFSETDKVVRSLGLVTVCEEARCPNMGECWSHHTATFMIMGELCTRRCGFCSVKDGSLSNLPELDPFEPYKVAQAVKELDLKHVVITSVNRDDVPDMGAAHFDMVVRALNKQVPDCAIELLIPDMQGKRELLEKILESGFVKVLNHNTETVPRLYRTVRPGAKFFAHLIFFAGVKKSHQQLTLNQA